MSFKEIISEIFTIDNLWHTLVTLGVTIPFVWFFPGLWFVPVIVSTVGLYVRELLQVKSKHGIWSFNLMGSFHKNMEWIVGSVASLIAALLMITFI